jgi:maltose-binding protein MalE
LERKKEYRLRKQVARCSWLICCIFALFITPAIAEKPKSLTLAYGLENYNFEPLFDAFTAETGIKIQAVSFKNNELKSELIQRANIQQLPDVVIVPSDFAGLNIIKVSPIPSELLNPDLSNSAIESSKVEGISRGIPLIYGNHLLLYYNKKLIKTPADSWEQLLAQQSQISEGKGLIGWNYMEMYWLIPFLGAYDSFPYKNGNVTLNTEGMVTALSHYKKFMEQGIVEQFCDHDCNMNKFRSSEIGYLINGTWAFKQLSDSLGDDLGIALLPTFSDNRMKTYFSSHLLSFPSNGLTGFKQKELVELARFMQSEKAQNIIWENLRAIPTNANVLQKLKQSKNENIVYMLTQLEYAEPMPNDQNMAIVWEAILKGLNRYLADVFDARAAAEYMQYVAKKSIDYANQE